MVFGGSTVTADGTFALTSLNGINGFRMGGKTSSDLLGYSVDAAGGNGGDTFVVFGKYTGFSTSIDLSALDGSDGFIVCR